MTSPLPTRTTYNFPPGPLPVKGVIAVLRTLRNLNRNVLSVLTPHFQNYPEGAITLNIGNTQVVMLSNADYVHDLLVTKAASFHKDPDYKDTKQGLARFLGNGLLVSDGAFWKRQRRLVAPALHAKRVENYATTMTDFTTQMLAAWDTHVQMGETHLDIAHEMMALTLNIVARTLFNVDVAQNINDFDQALEILQVVSNKRYILPSWLPTPQELQARKAIRTLDNIVYGIIRQRRTTNEDFGDLLSMLLLSTGDDGEYMTDKEARDEAITIFLAGHETTANALNWTFYLLAQYPEAERKLHEELDQVLHGRVPTLADLPRLTYTTMVIKEAMRMYPPAWAVSRQAIEDVQIGPYHLPKGSIVGAMIYFTHHDPRYWPEPEKFDPERFSSANEAGLHRYAYLPFGGGPRICIGNSFAMMEAQLLLATIASRYSLQLSAGQTVEPLPLITLNPRGGMPMTIVPRRTVYQTAPSSELVIA